MPKITRVVVRRFALPMHRPFVTAFGSVNEKRSILVELTVDGVVGIGEGSTLDAPLYIPEFDIPAYVVATQFLAKMLIGKEIETLEQLHDLMKPVKGYNFAKAAFEFAFAHALCQLQNASPRVLFGGDRTEIEVGESIGLHPDLDHTLREIGGWIEKGVRRIKLKIKPGHDIGLVQAVRRQFGDIPLMVDGNSGYTLDHADALKGLDEFGLMMIEQPLADTDIIDHATLQRQLQTPVCLDESIFSVDDARKAIEIGACKIINIKPGRVGGLVQSRRIHDLCHAKGIPVWIGGMLETSLGRFWNCVVASLPGVTLPADMSAPTTFYADEFTVHPYDFKNGLATVPESVDVWQVDRTKVDKYTVESATIE